MSERIFFSFVGAYILISLYFDVELVIYFLCLWLMFEAVTDFRLTTFTQQLMHKTVASGFTVFQTRVHFDYDAARVWRIIVAVMLGGSFILLHEYDFEMVWFFPWFLGFAILGAGVSGVCPVLLLIRWVGFR